jgi:hypothetical protein
MGLRAAVNAGAHVEKRVWEKALNHWKLSQLQDGGFDYSSYYGTRRSSSTNAMTAAGVMSIVMAAASIEEKKDAAEYAKDSLVQKGLEALEKHAKSALGNNYYWLYSLERACMSTGTERLGGFDWYVIGAWQIVRAQELTGLWPGSYGISDTCFALLFLKKSYVAVATPSGKSRPKPGEPREKE